MAANGFHFLDHFADHPVRRGSPGRDPDGLHPAQSFVVHLLFRFHLVAGGADRAGDSHQTPGIPAVKPSDHHQAVHLPGQLPDFLLAFMGGVADGIEDLQSGIAALQGLHHLLKQGFVLGGLGHDDHPFQIRQVLELLETGDDDPPVPRVTQEPDDLRVVLVPDDDGGVALLEVSFDNGLDFDNPRAGGVDDLETGLFSFSNSRGGTPWARTITVPGSFRQDHPEW